MTSPPLSRPDWALLFGARLRARRKELGKTLSEIADKMPCHKQSVWRWEHGEQLPDAYDLARLADALGCAVRTLLPRKEAPPSLAT